jgi:signal peptide peptidase SppA
MSRAVNKKIGDAVAFAMESLRLNKCQALHFGPWMIEPEWFRNAVTAINAGTWKAEGVTVEPDDDDENGSYQVVNGVAVMPLHGPMMKARSKFGGASTIDARSQIRKAVSDARVSAIMLHIDSPGGTVAGTDALAADVASANASGKPVYAHIDDMGASAAYYVASQAKRITASPSSLVGSLGTRMVIVDSSEAAKQDGLKVHDVSTGAFKGAGQPGTPVSDAQLKYFQGIVDDGNSHFKAAVRRGRGFSNEETDALFDGKVHDARQAQSFGLIDGVESFDSAMTAAITETSNMNAEAFKSYAAEHPEAVAGYIEQGQKAGIAIGTKAERDRSIATIEAAGENTDLAIEAIKAGHDADTVKIAAAAAEKEKVKAAAIAAEAAKVKAAADEAAKAVAEAHAKEVAELKEQMAAMPRGNEAASFSHGDAKPTGDAKAHQKMKQALGSDGLAKFAAGIVLPGAATAAPAK